MPNPSTLRAEQEEQYALYVERANDLSLSKSSRNAYLAVARDLAAELGIDGPPAVNGREAQLQAATVNVDRELFELLVEAAELHADDVIEGYKQGYYEEGLSRQLRNGIAAARALIK